MLRAATAFLGAVLLISTAAAAEKRVALVMGNGAYANVVRLPNATRNADAMAALFRNAGFDVVDAKRNIGLAAMRKALRDFTDHIRDADVAVVSLAGHSTELNGTNYLIPAGAVLKRDIKPDTIQW